MSIAASSTSQRSTPTGILLLSHPGQAPSSPADLEAALPPPYRALPRIPETLDLRSEIDAALHTQDFALVQRLQDEAYAARLNPRLEEYPGYLVAYFGSAPVPLAMHLGAKLGTFRAIEAFIHHHRTRAWAPGEPDAHAPALRPRRWPVERDRSAGEAIIRVSTSHPVDDKLTRRRVQDPLVEIDVALEQPHEDAFASGAEMEPVAEEFKAALDHIADHFPGVSKIHVFASVQPGVAFLLGTRISATMHPPVQTYQYQRSDDPPHYPAILINGPAPPEEASLTDEAVARAQRDRLSLEGGLQRLAGLADSRRPQEGQSFADAILPNLGHPFQGAWRHLPSLWDTGLAQTGMDVQTQAVPDSFRVHEDRWQIDDRWLARLARRLPDDERRQRALRLLVLHEAVHRGPQGLTTENSEGIGRFARVLEEMDYQADVWAQLYEYALSRDNSPKSVADPRAFFLDVIAVATETMWTFDDGSPRGAEIQVRRLHRYLMWCWQAEVLRRGTGTAEPMKLEQVLAVLSERPHVELAGPEIRTREERVYFLLDRVKMPELAVYDRGQLHRLGERYGLKITDILDGVRKRDTQRICHALRGAVAHIRRNR